MPVAAATICMALLLGVWLLYPLCVAAVVRVARRGGRNRERVGAPAADRTVTCILVTRESAPAVRARIADLLSADYDPALLSVVVGLDRNAKCHPAELADLDRVTIVQAGRPGKPSALNAAVAAARGEILVFADTFQRFDHSAIRQLVEALADPAVGAVSGNLERGERWRLQPVVLYWRLERWLRHQESSLHSCVGVTGAIYAMNKANWKDLSPDVLCDDLHVPMRLITEGKRVIFEPTAIAHDARDMPPQDEFRRKVRTLTGNFQLVREMPVLMNPWRNPIWLQFVCHKLLRLLSPYFLIGILLSGLAFATLTLPAPFGVLVALAIAVGVAWLASPMSPHASARSVLLMFAATLLAGWHAFFGDWGVWTEAAGAIRELDSGKPALRSRRGTQERVVAAVAEQ